MISFFNSINIKLKHKLCKENNIRVIAVLPDGEIFESIRTWGGHSKKNNLRSLDIRHENLIEENIMKKLVDRGYKPVPLLETKGILGRYPLMASLIREYSITFILKSYIVDHDYNVVISCIPHEITEEQYKIVNKYNKDNIDSIVYDDGEAFAIIDKPIEEYVKNRIK